MAEAPQHRVLDLRCGTYERGRAQAELCPDRIADVAAAVTRRLHDLGPALAEPKVSAWLDAEHAFLQDHDLDGFVEVQGIADGFGIAPDALFACLFAEVIADLASTPSPGDGATAWASRHGPNGPVVVKNRDVRDPAPGLQRLFRHADPEWGGRRFVCVGTLGAPGALSSGINADGLAIADTPVRAGDHGAGWLRSLLMTRILRECTTVAEAIALVFRVPHVGGGTLVLGDAKGAVAAVELVQGRVAAEEPADGGFVARTDHYVSEQAAGRDLAAQDDIGARKSRARLSTIEQALRAMPTPFTIDSLRTLMSRHGDRVSAALCRHDAPGPATISCAIHDCQAKALYVALGPPCENGWTRIEV